MLRADPGTDWSLAEIIKFKHFFHYENKVLVKNIGVSRSLLEKNLNASLVWKRWDCMCLERLRDPDVDPESLHPAAE